MPRGLELLIAQTILQGFDAQYGRFLEVTSGAQQRFEQADWHAVQQAMKNRIHLYDHHVGLVVSNCAALLTAKVRTRHFYYVLKSITPGCRRITRASRLRRAFLTPCTVGYLTTARLLPSGFLSLALSQSAAFVPFPARWRKTFTPITAGESLLMRVISDLPLRLRWQNKSRDIHYIIRHLTETLGTDNLAESHLQVANELFYRNKAAWLVGKLITPSGTLPFLLPIHQTDDGELFIDTCLTTTAEASIVFGFARSYFMVYAPLPAALVEWLREILPGKTTAELYMAIGCQKHAKTESYREYLVYLQGCNDSSLKRRVFVEW